MRGLILLALGIGLLVVLYRIFQRTTRRGRQVATSTGSVRAGEAEVVKKDVSELTITDAQLKDMVSVSGAGAEFEDVDFTVDRRNRYESGGDAWYEVSGLHRGKRVHLEYYEDDVVRAQLSLPGPSLSLADLGVGEEDLVRMDEERSRSNAVEHEGERFGYVSSSECTYYRDGLGQGEGYYGWEFRSEDGSRVLFVEKWEGEPFEIGLAKVISPEDIRVFRS